MHLLLARAGTVAEAGEAVDLGQSAADLVVLSAADTELAALAGAARRQGLEAPSLRLANLLRLQHPMSVDTSIERTFRHAGLIVVRLLGGAGYWPYGCEALLSLAQRSGVRLAVLPGDDKPDPGLERFSTVPQADRERLWRCLCEGGAANADAFLAGCRSVIEGRPLEIEPRPLMKAGVLERGVARSQGASPSPAVDGGASSPSRPPARRSPSRGQTRPGADLRPVAAVVFYRALVQSGQTAPVDALCAALETEGFEALPVFVASLKDPVSAETVRAIFARQPPSVVVNLTGFAVSSPGGAHVPTVLEENGAVVLQAVLSGGREEAWAASARGLFARDLAMNVALPEVDGRVMTRAVAFKAAAEWDAATECEIVEHRAVPDRLAFVARLARNWARLRATPAAERRVAILLANYPNRDGRIANGVGLDTPAGTIAVLRAMSAAGYDTGAIPDDGDALVAHILKGPTNDGWRDREVREWMPASAYAETFAALPEAVRQSVTERWGGPEADPFFDPARGFALPLARFGHVIVGIQPARGYNIDPKETYHSPDLVPPHHYIATYAYLREVFGIHAVVHMGKHGNLEWLPGKALALSRDCLPEAVLGPLPHLYPFIVNDPGEGTQAKRRASAVIVDHLTPPLTRAESYGPLRDLERLVDEVYAADGDARRTALLKRQIFALLGDEGIGADAGIASDETGDAALERLDAWLCDLKEMQIRDGLHIFGLSPEGRLLTDLVVALARLPRGYEAGDASLHRAIATDLELSGTSDASRRPFDPLDCDLSAPWTGPRPQLLHTLSTDPWRTAGDTVERIELLASGLVSGEIRPDIPMPSTAPVLAAIESRLKPAVTACGPAEIAGLLAGLDGRFVPPGPSGAPSRGRPDVLPTGRNFFSVDVRAVPTPAAFTLGAASAELLVTRHLQDHGEWPAAIGLTCWGTANMRTGGDDLAQALALIGARPVWDLASGRVTGYAIRTLAELGRPRVDVTLRISGFFRDAFPDQIALFDRAARAIGALDEPAEDNPIAARMAAERADLEAAGLSHAEADARAGFRIFGSKPGAYGAGLQALVDEGGWRDAGDLAEGFLVWGSYAYGHEVEGDGARAEFEARLGRLDAVVQNQDNREHDLLDSDDYYQFEGGMTAAVEHLSGARPAVYHNDHSRPERPVIRTLQEEIARVVRARVVNPKWIAGVMRHGYKGAFEMAATVDYLFAFAATTGAVADHHFDAVHRAYLLDETVRGFLLAHNEAAYREMNARLLEAIDRGLWSPRSNSARMSLAAAHPAAPASD
ncbi:hypothetical protein ASG43_11205 [Aureimonas sp. Leaf454]|uniref:cobaltochelatase subunit CobN n=1 Tax=Aureimonas sp. Leaf454 TaxID=1736381 RepID=UPI0006FC7320|nr:cobaltochelatase subunit CobN [Aureimonas sp. Leaf454]KQT46204.1 hypothetical protein ASG43_11205 [Aureimonas sp. Leaf454]